MRPRPPLLLVAFAVFGAQWGAWQAVVPDLAAHYGLSTGPLGAILTAGFVVAMPAMIGVGRLVDRVGAGRGMAIPAAAMAVGLVTIGLLPSMPAFVAGVVLVAAGSGAYDVAINGAAMGHATWSRPARLTLLHAAFSGGGVVGALAGGVLASSSIPFQLVYVVVAAGLVVLALVAARQPWRASHGSAGVPRSIALAMLPLAALAALAFLAEGSIETWSAIYLRVELGAAAFVGALGPAAFHAAMLAGRLVGAGVAHRLGSSRTLLVASTLTVGGMSAALLVPEPGTAIPGLAIAALGASFVVPVVVSLAARRAGAHAGRAASYVLSLGYAGFLVGPSLVGIVGEIAGLRAALVVVPLAAGLVSLASRSRLARD